MTTGFERITARRVWFVPSFVVWGLPVWEEVEFLTVEKVGSDEAVLYGSLDIGGTAQQVAFSDLTGPAGPAARGWPYGIAPRGYPSGP